MNLLFIIHDTTRTGAPFVLLYFLQWLKEQHPEVDFSVLAVKGGSLREDFEKLTPEFIDFSSIKNPGSTFKQEFMKRVERKLGKKSKRIDLKEQKLQKLAAQNFDLIYANTVNTVPLAIQIKKLNGQSKLIVHIHELNTIIFLNIPDFSSYVSEIDFFISASNLVKKNLLESYAIPLNKVETIYEFTPQKPQTKKKEKNSYFMVGGAGTVHWRKGSDLFVQVAKYIKTNYPESKIKFQWIGSISKMESLIINSDIEKAGLKEMISFIGEKENPGKYFIDFDIFLLPSREDPFPLVAIEMGMQGKPIICFENATGTEEVLKHGGGYIVSYLDIEAMAEKIIFYYRNPEHLVKDGEMAEQLFSEFVPEKICPKIFEAVKEVDG